MPNPEQQQNISNLQTFENEVALTRAEIEAFNRLPKKEQKKQEQERLAKLLELQDRLEQAVKDGAVTGNFDEAKRIKIEIEKEISDLEQIIYVVFPFYPERDITEEEWQEMAKPLISKNFTSDKYDWEDVSRAYALKVLKPEFVTINYNNFDLVSKCTELSTLGSKNYGWDLANFAAELKIIKPTINLGLDTVSWQAMKNQLEKCRQEDNWTGFSRQASKMKIIDPNFDLNIDDMAWLGMSNALELCRLLGKSETSELFNWANFSIIASQIKILNPEFDFKLTKTEWQGMKDWIKRGGTDRPWRYMEMKILAAEVVEVTSDGLKVEMIRD